MTSKEMYEIGKLFAKGFDQGLQEKTAGFDSMEEYYSALQQNEHFRHCVKVMQETFGGDADA